MRTMQDVGNISIPVGWTYQKIKTLVKGLTDGTHGTYERLGEGFPLLSAKNVFEDGIHISKNESLISENDYKSITANGFPHRGDILLCCVGTIGRTTIYKEDQPMAFQRSVIFMTPNNDIITSEWLNYTLMNPDVIAQEECMVNQAAQPGLYQGSVRQIKVPVPSLSEQHVIVSFLDRKCAAIDDSIAKHKAIIEKLEEYRKAEITRAVTKGLNPDVKMKESGIPWAGQIPEGWVVIHQKYLAHIFGRIGFRGYTQKDIVDKGEGPITLSPSNMANGKMDYLGCTYLSWDKYDESPEIQIHNNDILMVKTGSSYGKVAWVDCLPMEATINPQIVVLKNITCNPRYLFYYMQSEIYQYQVHKAVVGGTIPTLSQRAMDRYIIIIPSNINEQLDVVHYLDNYTEKIAKAVDKHNQLIAKLEEYKKSLIYNVVTGKIDCREGA